jgi:hypothetical protein
MKLTTLFLLPLGLLFMQNCTATDAANGTAVVTDDFRRQIAKGQDVLVENQEIADAVDFTELVTAQLVAPGNRRAHVGSAVTFRKCRFRGRVTAFRADTDGTVTTIAFGKNLSFIDCTFDDEVSFRGAAVTDLACFSGCIFLKKAVFEDLDALNNAWFSQSRFDDEARFQNANFRRKADFFEVEFGKPCNFQGAVFAGDAQFGGVKSYKYADFSTAQFSGHAFFNYAELHGQAMFDNTWFRGRAEFISSKFVTASFKNSWFLGQTRFNKAVIDQQLDMAGVHVTGEKPDWSDANREKVKNLND